MAPCKARIDRTWRVLSCVSLVCLWAVFGGSLSSSAAQSDELFPIRANYDDEEWIEIAPSEAVRLVDDAIAKQPKYGSGRAQVLIYLADEVVLDRSALIELFGQLKTTDSPAKLREKTAPVRREEKDFLQKWNWSEVTIAEDGDDVIETCEKWSSEAWSSTYLSTDKIKIVYEGAQRQADVALPGLQNRAVVDRLASFYTALQPVKEQHVVSAAKNSDYVKLVRGSQGGPSRTTIFSRRDGSVLHDYSTSASGRLIKETWQGSMKEWAGGVRYPTSLLSFRYRDSDVDLVQAAAVKEAEFNVRVDPREFAVAIPVDTTVVDVREGEPAVVRVKEPIDDLSSALASGPLTKVIAKKELNGSPASSRRTVLIVLNVVVIAALLVLVLLVRRRATGLHR